MSIEHMTDIYGVACDVHLVRTFRDGRQLGGGYDIRSPVTWFVYDREDRVARWHKHSGPMSSFEQTVEWIQAVREDRSRHRSLASCSNCGGLGSMRDMQCCPVCGGGGQVLK